MAQKYKTDYLQSHANPTYQIEDQTEETAPASQIYPAEKATTNELRRAVLQPGAASHSTILNLQTRYGNQAVQRLLANRVDTTVQRGLLSNIKNKVKDSFATKKKDILKGAEEDFIIKTLLDDPVGRESFSEYCEKEFSQHNLTAYNFILNYEKSPSEEKARYFNTTFVGTGSKQDLNVHAAAETEQELNIDASIARNYRTKIAQAGTPDFNLSEVSKLLLGPMKSGVFSNIVDTFRRFVTTKAYSQWLNSVHTASDSVKF